MRRRLVWAGTVAIAAACSVAQGAWFGTQFSADTIQKAPDRPPVTGKMYVGKGRMRTEFHHNGKTMIEIVDPRAGREYMLFPAQRRYLERPLSPSATTLANRTDDANPCAGMAGVTCRDLGKVMLNGRAAEKWAMTGTMNGRTVHGMEWTDLQHHFPVRRQFEGRVTFALRYEGKATVEGRAVEKWVSTATGAHGRTMKVTQWYDPKLNIAIRQKAADGYVRELHNIKEGPQPVSLFELPAGYTKMALPGR